MEFLYQAFNGFFQLLKVDDIPRERAGERALDFTLLKSILIKLVVKHAYELEMHCLSS